MRFFLCREPLTDASIYSRAAYDDLTNGYPAGSLYVGLWKLRGTRRPDVKKTLPWEIGNRYKLGAITIKHSAHMSDPLILIPALLSLRCVDYTYKTQQWFENTNHLLLIFSHFKSLSTAKRDVPPDELPSLNSTFHLFNDACSMTGWTWQ